ncbi:unnamed protein product [Bemisia tabaci]|uniref:Uncharacterized protein n=1 Tax=Bemisia tabaci TaxID=7038 RepID=A0A9P0CF94_BEMTA|nr:unnamed protein product [Bemisia tabaci]
MQFSVIFTFLYVPGKRTLSRENTPPSRPSCVASPDLSRVGLPYDVPTAPTSSSPKSSASPSKTRQRSPPRPQPSSKSQSQIPPTTRPTPSPILSTVELSEPLPVAPSFLPPSRAPPSSPQNSPKNSLRSSPKNSPKPSSPPLPKLSPLPSPKPKPRSSPSPPQKPPTSSPQGTIRASSVGDQLSGSPPFMHKSPPPPQPKPKWRFPLAAMPVSPPASPPPTVQPKPNPAKPRSSFRLTKWRNDELIDPEQYMAPMVSADPNQILYRRLQNELLRYFARDDNPPQRDAFRMELVKIWEAECKLIPMYEAEIGKTFLKKFCLKELDPEDHVPVCESVPLKQGCMIQCAKSWGYIFIPGGNGSGDATDVFACGSLIPITRGEVSRDPEHAPKINPMTGDITHVCNCALAPELYKLFDMYKISYPKFMQAKDESQERALEFLETEFWPHRIMLMSHKEFLDWVVELFRKHKIPNPEDDYSLYEKKTKALGGEADEKAEDGYWKQQNFYRAERV